MTIKAISKIKKTDQLTVLFHKKEKHFTLFSDLEPIVSQFDSLKKLAKDPSGTQSIINIEETPTLVNFIEVKSVSANDLESFRRAGATLAKNIKSQEPDSVLIDFTKSELISSLFGGASFSELAGAFLEGFMLAIFQFNELKSGDRKKEYSAKSINFYTQSTIKTDVQSQLDRAQIAAEGQITARKLVLTPSNYLTPKDLAKVAKSSAEKYGFECEVLNKKQIKDLKMGGLLAVNFGSHNEPVFIIMEHKPKGKAKKKVVLVGKGITFDTGGISLKPGPGMGEMKGDMAGAAAVIGTMETVARLNLPIHVIGLIPSTDNMPSGTAQCPGDILTTMNGLTVEVDNTDAEGRLILADGLEYAKRYNPEHIIDLATLTGACVIALGHHAAGLFTTDDELDKQLSLAGSQSYERVWRLPLFEEYEEQLKSDVADVKNIGGRPAGSITAAKFLQKFVDEKQSWAHIDIAGTALPDSGFHYSFKGGSGFGVRLLTRFISNL